MTVSYQSCGSKKAEQIDWQIKVATSHKVRNRNRYSVMQRIVHLDNADPKFFIGITKKETVMLICISWRRVGYTDFFWNFKQSNNFDSTFVYDAKCQPSNAFE